MSLTRKQVSGNKGISLLYLCSLSLSFCIQGCKHKNTDIPVKKPGGYYYLHVGKHLREYDDSLAPKDELFDYRITVYINDNPVSVLQESTGILAINEFIKPGENRVKLELEGPQPVEAAVTSTPDFRSQVVEKRVQYDPNENSSLECSFTFSANIDYTLPIYLPQNRLTVDKEEITRHVLSLLSSIFQAAEKKDYKKVLRIWAEGDRLYAPYAFGISTQEIDRRITENSKNNAFLRGDSKFRKYEPDEYVIKCGESLILVYRKDGENIFTSGFKEVPTIIACIDGEYIIWLAAPTL